MALIFQLQITQSVLDRQGSSDDNFPIAHLLFESLEEKRDFLADPEKFVRKVGFYSPDMPFNGHEPPQGMTLNDVMKNPDGLKGCYHIKSKTYCIS